MSRTVAMRFGLLPGTRAGVGRAGARTLVADRPEGVAGGQGLGFNGAELLAAALGGCFWNDLHYAAEARGIVLGAVDVTAETHLSGTPLRVTSATIRARVAAETPAQARECFEAARAESTIANSVMAAVQQIEDFDDGTMTANDCFRPVVRYFDRISRPEHLLTALPRAMRVLTDPADCGPVCLAFCQDVQAEAFDYPESFFTPKVWRTRRVQPDPVEVAEVVEALRAAQRPVIVSGGGVIYSEAEADLLAFAKTHNIPVVETQAGKGAVDWQEPLNFGSPGVTGSDCGNRLAAEADLILGVGTRFQDFTTGSWTTFANPQRRLVSINVTGYDAAKHGAMPLVSDAKVALEQISLGLLGHRFPDPDFASREAQFAATTRVFTAPGTEGANALPSDGQVIGAVSRVATDKTVVMCAAGAMPGALQILWRSAPGGYHMEYGYSCMGYEVAGALGIAMAAPEKEVICFVGDGSYMMANSELATAVMMRVPFTIVLTDNRGYGCINRLQQECGGAEFNNMYKDSRIEAQPQIDFVAHAAAMGAHAVKVGFIAELEASIREARERQIPTVVVIDTEAVTGPGAGGAQWDVAVPEVGTTDTLKAARERYEAGLARQRVN